MESVIHVIHCGSSETLHNVSCGFYCVAFSVLDLIVHIILLKRFNDKIIIITEFTVDRKGIPSCDKRGCVA